VLPIESFAQGVPCLIGPISYLFRDHTFLREVLVVDQPYNPGLIADMGAVTVAGRARSARRLGRSNREVEVPAREALNRFLAERPRLSSKRGYRAWLQNGARRLDPRDGS
jgi:hypothetical protein